MEVQEREATKLETQEPKGKDTADAKALRLIPENDQEAASLFHKTYGKGLSMLELALFWTHAKKVKLDPLQKQIHAVPRQTKNGRVVTHQVSIDGLRAIAFRAGDHAGTDEIEYTYKSEDDKYPHKAVCTTYKMLQGMRVKFVGTAKWDEFYPGDKMGFQWRKMPEVMLGKCAEAQALRKGWPEDLEKLYVHEEMDQAGKENEIKVVSSGKADKINQLFSGTQGS